MPDEQALRRARLRGLFKLLSLLGLALLLIPFISSLLPREEEEDRRRGAWEITVDVSDLGMGEISKVEWPGGPVWIYRRDPGDAAALRGDHTALNDAASANSEQPDWARTATRSRSPELFVFIPLEPSRNCQVRLTAASGDLPAGFEDPCSGARFDLAGRTLKEAGKPMPANLRIPPYRLLAPDQVQLQVPPPRPAG